MTDYEFKIIIVGDAGVGKTSMIASMLGEPVPEIYVQTQGSVVSTLRITYQNKNIVLKLWDMSGGDDYRTYIAGCFGGAQAAIITYSMVEVESLLHVRNWYDTIHSVFEIRDARAFESLQTIVVGLRSDSKMKQVSPDQGENAAQSIGCSHFIGNYKDAKTYKTILYKLMDMLLANIKQREIDVTLQNRRQQQHTVHDDPSQPLLKKDKAEGRSICDCDCDSCTIL